MSARLSHRLNSYGLDALCLSLVLVGGGLLAVWVLTQVRAFADYPAGFDEAVHLLPALQLAYDLRVGQWADFAGHTYTQDAIALYPFVHAWLVTPFFLFIAPEVTVGRATGLFFLWLTFGGSYLVGREAHWREGDPNGARLAGMISAISGMVALPLWVYASVAYVEAAGLLITVVGWWCYLRAGSDATRPGWLTATSLALATALLTKYSFGVFMVGGVVLAEIVNGLTQRKLPSLRRWVYLFLPFGLIALGWFSGSGKWERFWTYSQAQQTTGVFWSFENLGFYPRSLWQHYASGPLQQILLISGLGLSLVRWRSAGPRLLLSYALVSNLVLLTIPQKEMRFVFIVAPALYPGVGSAVVEIGRWVWRQVTLPSARLGLSALLIIALVVEARAVSWRFSFFTPALETAYTSPPVVRQIYRWIEAATLLQGVRPHLMNEWYMLSAYGLNWDYYSLTGGSPAEYHYQLASGGLAPEPTPEQLEALATRLTQMAPSAIVSIDGAPAGNYTSWQVVEPLLARGDLETYPDEPTFTILQWPATYWERVMAGDFADWAEFTQVRQAQRAEFSITLHLYFWRSTQPQ